MTVMNRLGGGSIFSRGLATALLSLATPAAAEINVQLGSYSEATLAIRAMERIEEQRRDLLNTIDIYVARANVAGNVVYRVLVGPFDDETPAADLCMALKRVGESCFVNMLGNDATVTADMGLESLVLLDDFNFAGGRDGSSANVEPATDTGSEMGYFDTIGEADVAAYQKSAQAGEPSAQFALAKIYDEGIFVTENDAQALYWYQQAAAQGFALAQHNLGAMYGNGEGGTRDLLRAYLWFSVAALSLVGEARNVAEAHAEIVGAALTQEQLALAHVLIRQCTQTQYRICD